MIPKNQESCIDIDNFFTMNLGNWLTQKTSYNPSSKKHTTSTTKTFIKKIEDHTSILNLLNNNKDENLSTINKIQAYNITSEKGRREASSVLTYIEQHDSKSNGIIYKIGTNKNNQNTIGEFQLIGNVLKILIKHKRFAIEEKIWFINKNLKLTKSIIKREDHCVLISFVSEIKIE